jgi:L-fuconolactonase
MSEPVRVPKIDAHQHFWRYRREDYPWMTPDMEVLRRDYMPQDLHPHLQAHGIDACIAVQARACEAETDFLLELANQHEWIAGVVGWVDLRADDVAQRIARWQNAPKLCGFRHQLQDEQDVRRAVRDPRFQRGVAEVQAAGSVYEVLVYGHQLDSAVELCAEHDRHYLVLDHLGKPAIRANDFAVWHRQMQLLRSMPHVVCKVSGLLTEAVDAEGKYVATEIERYLDAALEVFGTRRLIFGSDWPVSLLVAPYAAVRELVADSVSALSPAEQDDVLGATAQRCYGLTVV